MPEPALTVIVRATVALGCQTGFVLPTRFCAGEVVEGNRAQPDDFVPLRPVLDLLFSGHVEMVGVPTNGVWMRQATVGFAESLETLVLACGAPGRVPLRPPYTRWLDGSAAEIGPGPVSASWTETGLHEEGFDFDLYQGASPPLQFEGMPVGEPLILDGLFESDVRVETMMPALAPRLFFDPSQPEDTPRDILLRLDTILVDTDRRVVDLTWRGFLKLPRAARVACDRLVIGWVDPATWDNERAGAAWLRLLRELPRGEFFWATERADALAGREPPPLTEEEAVMARFASWDQSAAPTAQIEISERARIAAELAEQREPRVDILARHELDEHGWSLEERATLEELARPPTSPAEAASQERYARAFVEAQESFAKPAEADVSLEAFARIIATAENGRHEPVLREMGLGLGAVFRLERRFRRAAIDNPRASYELSEALAAARRTEAATPSDPAHQGATEPRPEIAAKDDKSPERVER